MASGITGASSLGARYQRCNHGLKAEAGYTNDYCKLRRREAAIDEGKKPLTTKDSGGAS